MFKKQKFFFFILCLISFHTLTAKEYLISSAAELAALDLKPGDKVLMKDGDWDSQNLVFSAIGTKNSPIYLRAATPGKVILKGQSKLLIEGDWLIVEGLKFTDGYTAKENVITFSEKSSNCRLTNSAIIDYNHPQTKAIFNFWIVVYGIQNRVDHCFLKGKTTRGTTVGVNIGEKPNYHRIDHNYFAHRPDVKSNGGETIRIGTDKWSMHDSYTTVEDNIFEHCDGEIEIISNKSGHNTIRNNLFYESKGTLTLRHGNFANVYGNYFIGNGVEGTGGIRIIGENHKIYENYFSGLTGTGVKAVFAITNAWENPPLHGYWQVKNVEISENTVVNCGDVFTVGAGKNEKTFIAPQNVLISNNTLSDNGSLFTWLEKDATLVFNNNTSYKTSSTIALPAGITEQKPALQLVKPGIYVTAKAKKAKVAERLTKLLKAEDIGLSWMKVDVELKIKK